MTREEARDVLANTPWLKCNGDEVEQAVMVAIEALGALPPAGCSEGQWKLCSEEMPEESEWIGTDVFGTTVSDKVHVTFEAPDGTRFVSWLRFQNGKLGPHDQRMIDVILRGSTPVAWMPGPEPYAGDIERKEK